MADRAPLGTLTAAFERTGSPCWLMDLIQQQGLDRTYGFDLRIHYLDDGWQGGRHATEAALVAGEVDFIDCDWLALLRCRREGLKISAVYPYGRILGGLVVPPESRAQKLPQLLGARIGVVSRRDKNWTLLCAYSRRVLSVDLTEAVEVRETGSKTTLQQALLEGELDAALVYWHQIPALLHRGYRLLIDIPLLLPALGVDPVPTTFFIFRDQLIAEQPALIRGFVQAYRNAVRQLARNRGNWGQIGRERLGIDDSALIEQLRRYWQGRIAQPWERSQLQRLWPLAEQLQGGEPHQFHQAFAWSFMNDHPLKAKA